MEAVIYGVILKAKMVNWLKEPPENRSNKSNNPVSPVNTCARAERLIPGTGMLESDSENHQHQQGENHFASYFSDFKGV